MEINNNENNTEILDAVPEQTPVPPVANSSPSNGKKKYGGFWIRLVAIIADSVILTFASTVLMFLAVLIIPDYGGQVISFVILIGTLLYYVLMTSSRHQATIGKRLAGLRVERASDGARLSFGRSLARELAKIISAAPAMIGFIIAGFTSKKQALHDYIAGTVTVKHKPAKTGALVAIILGPIILQIALVMLAASLLAGALFGGLFSNFGPGSIDPSIITTYEGINEINEEEPVQYLTTEEYEQVLASFNPEDEFYIEEPAAMVGPALLELDSRFDDGEQDTITVYMPAVPNVTRGEVVVYLDGVYSTSGENELDVDSSFENDAFFNSVSFETWFDDDNNPVYHEGARKIHYRGDELTLENFDRAEGRLLIQLPLENGETFEKVYPFIIK
jgi:uncharacterized RDD family membrane protein YckC